MVAFNLTEIDPEQLPVVEKRIRQAQETELDRIGGELPVFTSRLERNFDEVNRQHRAFIRSGNKAPKLVSTALLHKYTNGWLLNPWIVLLIQLAAVLLVMLPLVISTWLHRQELPWIQSSSSSIDKFGITLVKSSTFISGTSSTAGWMILCLAMYYYLYRSVDGALTPLATARIADELVVEHTFTPELAQRLKDATWRESRILYTTPELSSKAVVPTPSQLVTLAARI